MVFLNGTVLMLLKNTTLFSVSASRFYASSCSSFHVHHLFALMGGHNMDYAIFYFSLPSYFSFMKIGGAGETWTPNILLATQALFQIELQPHIKLAPRVGLEPTYNSLTGSPPTNGAPGNGIWRNEIEPTYQPPVLQTGALPIELPLQNICQRLYELASHNQHPRSFPRGFALLTLVLPGRFD